VLAGDAAHLNNPLGAFGLNGGLHDAILLAEYLGKVCRGEADDDLLDLYVRKRRTANIDFVQTQSIANKKHARGRPTRRSGARSSTSCADRRRSRTPRAIS
jgi:2-polyprenyl-6-methoxyphenol hydroxylase-like FAD-dependent oxidoreductase